MLRRCFENTLQRSNSLPKPSTHHSSHYLNRTEANFVELKKKELLFGTLLKPEIMIALLFIKVFQRVAQGDAGHGSPLAGPGTGDRRYAAVRCPDSQIVTTPSTGEDSPVTVAQAVPDSHRVPACCGVWVVLVHCPRRIPGCANRPGCPSAPSTIERVTR